MAALFSPILRCPFCTYQLPSGEDRSNEIAQDHFVNTHKAIVAKIPENDTEPLTVEIGISPSNSKKMKNVIILLSKADVMCLSVTRIEKKDSGSPALSTVVYKIYGDPGVVTLTTPSNNMSFIGETLSTNVACERILGSPHLSFCCSYDESPSEFVVNEKNKMTLKMLVFFGYQPMSPSTRRVKRSGASISLLDGV